MTQTNRSATRPRTQLSEEESNSIGKTIAKKIFRRFDPEEIEWLTDPAHASDLVFLLSDQQS